MSTTNPTNVPITLYSGGTAVWTETDSSPTEAEIRKDYKFCSHCGAPLVKIGREKIEYDVYNGLPRRRTRLVGCYKRTWLFKFPIIGKRIRSLSPHTCRSVGENVEPYQADSESMQA